MTRHMVVIYFARLGAPLEAHERSTLTAVAQSIAQVKGCEFGGCFRALNDLGDTFFVPDDTLVSDEAACLGIRGSKDLFGGVVPYPFVKTKVITHGLIDARAAHPEGWCSEFASKISDAVLPGFTVFSGDDARTAAAHLMTRGPVRAKPPLATGGRAQRVLTNTAEVDTFLERIEPDRLASFGLVLEANMHGLTTLSVGQITLDNLMMTYYGTQRSVTDNEGRCVYGGSDLVCVRGGWGALDDLPLSDDLRTEIAQARAYDAAISEYPGVFASRRNYDIGQGLDPMGRWRSGVFEASWRVGGASTAELVALADFHADPDLKILEVSTVKEYGRNRQPPQGAVVHFCGDDPEAGPLMRYTLVARRSKSKRMSQLFGSTNT